MYCIDILPATLAIFRQPHDDTLPSRCYSFRFSFSHPSFKILSPYAAITKLTFFPRALATAFLKTSLGAESPAQPALHSQLPGDRQMDK